MPDQDPGDQHPGDRRTAMADAGVQAAAPMAPRIPSRRVRHGHTDTDNYAWMRAPAAPALRDYLTAERAYYDAQTQHLGALTDALFGEAVARTATTADSVSWTLRDFRYWYRTPPGAEGRQLMRAPRTAATPDVPVGRTGPAVAARPDGEAGQQVEQVLLDENELSAGTGFVDIGISEISPDDRLLAWSADMSGAEIYRLRFTDLQTGQLLPDVIERSYPGGAWASDCEHFFYLVPDELNRPHQVWRHRIGSGPADDVMAYQETDARYELTLRASRSGELILITSACRDTTEVRVLPASQPLTAPMLVEPRRRGVEYRVDHATGPMGGAGDLFIVTDDGAAEFTLMRAPASAPGRPNWVPVDCAAVGPAQDGTRLLTCDVFADYLLLTVRRAGSPMLISTDRSGHQVQEISPVLVAGSIAVQHAEDYHTATVIIAEESLIEPPRWSELDLATGERTEVKRAEVPGYDAGHYCTKRVHARAADGVEVPVTLAYRSSTPLDGSAACLLYGYGAYEACLDPEFDRSLPSVLDRGVVYAVAHVRGGGECGRGWWQQGRLRSKPRTFSDFVDVADWLAGSADGAPALIDGNRIVSRGLSAGGLLQGAVYSRAPGRWRAVVAEVPFVDCVTTMLDPSIPLTINEWDEWGDPRDPADFACLRSYSPYDNPPPGVRPDLLVTGAVHDPRVLVHEPAKWVARLRETDTHGSRILFRVELGAGAHTGPSGRFDHLRYEAEVYAFVLDAVGLGDQAMAM
ncbi:MAG: S9 family peptidase [Streptosporangiaceae bacterium]